MKGKVLVTGGAGYIGSHTVAELQAGGYEAVIIDNLSNAHAAVIDGIARISGVRPTFVQGDCNDKDVLRALFAEHRGLRGVIHFAASKAVGESVREPLKYYRNNIVPLLNLLELMPEFGVEALVFSSSCTVYGEPDRLPVTEDAPVKAALSPYGNTKQIGEEMIRDASRANRQVKSIILRYFNPAGAHPSGEIGELPLGEPQNLTPLVAQTAIGLRPMLNIYGNDYSTPDGTCIRDYIHVMDVAKAHVAALNRLLSGKASERTEVFNLGTGRGVSVLELLKAFERVTGVKVPCRIAQRRAGDIAQVWADPARAKQALDWTAHETLDETLHSAWKWQQRLRNC